MSTLKYILIAILTWASQSYTKTYTIGVESLDYMPFYTSEGGEYQGAARDILEAFASDKGYTFVFKPMPINRLFISLTSSQIDMKFPDSPYWKKDLKQGVDVKYSEAVFDYIDGVIVRKEMKGKGKNQLKVLGVFLGFTAWDYLGDINAGKIQQKENPSFRGMFSMLKAGNYDGVYINVDVANFFLNSKEKKMKDEFTYDPSLPHTNGQYKASSVKSPHLVNELNIWMKANSAKVGSIKSKYGVK